MWLDCKETKSAGDSYIAANPSYTPTWWLYDSGDACFATYHTPAGTGIPQSMIFDRDGYQRWLQYGGIHNNPKPMHDCIAELR